VTTAFTKASSASPPATTKTAFWNQPLAAALTDFGTSAEGLVSAEAERRLQQYGRNDATGPHRPHAVVRPVLLASFSRRLLVERPTRTENVVVFICLQYSTEAWLPQVARNLRRARAPER
jgi:hypothetical protein